MLVCVRSGLQHNDVKLNGVKQYQMMEGMLNGLQANGIKHGLKMEDDGRSRHHKH